MMTHEAWFERATRVIPGGVNSPVRAFNGVGGTPVYVSSGRGATVTTADGRTLIDFCCSWGAMILGHAHPEVTTAIQQRAALGTTFGINTPDEVVFAERLCACVPGMARVRAVSSGTEAVMTAIRIARGVTRRCGIVKFDGCYHGHSDSVLVAAGSGLLTGGIAGSLGVPADVARDTYVVPYNDVAAVERIFAARGESIAAILVEPVAGNMGLVLPDAGFLAALRGVADAYGALLICDEVINGFRFGMTSYSARVGVEPDLLTLGKIIGGGLPLAAVGGKAALMDRLAPAGDIYQAGTLAGNPLAVAAGLATLDVLARENPYPRMAALGSRLADGVNAIATRYSLPMRCVCEQGVFTLFATQKTPIRTLADAKTCDTALYARMFHAMLDAGFYLPPSQFEVGFVSAAHTEADIDAFLTAFAQWASC